MQLCRNEELVIEREILRLKEAQEKEAAGHPDLTFCRPAFQPRHSWLRRARRQWKHRGRNVYRGTLNKDPGRVGDSSLIGCGCYADNLSAATSCTGWGEPIMKLVLAKWAADRVRTGGAPDAVAQDAMRYLKDRLNGHGGMICWTSAAASALPTTRRVWPGLIRIPSARKWELTASGA